MAFRGPFQPKLFDDSMIFALHILGLSWMNQAEGVVHVQPRE